MVLRIALSNSLLAEQTAAPARPSASPKTSCRGAAAIDQIFAAVSLLLPSIEAAAEDEEVLGTARVMKTV